MDWSIPEGVSRDGLREAAGSTLRAAVGMCDAAEKGDLQQMYEALYALRGELQRIETELDRLRFAVER